MFDKCSVIYGLWWLWLWSMCGSYIIKNVHQCHGSLLIDVWFVLIYFGRHVGQMDADAWEWLWPKTASSVEWNWAQVVSVARRVLAHLVPSFGPMAKDSNMQLGFNESDAMPKTLVFFYHLFWSIAFRPSFGTCWNTMGFLPFLSECLDRQTGHGFIHHLVFWLKNQRLVLH
jgi:hypothetical protein